MSSRPDRNRYRAYGLGLDSCLPLPDVSSDAPGAEAEIAFVEGAVPAELPDALVRGVRFQAARDRVLLTVDGIARYLVAEGSRVTIDRSPGVGDDDVRLYLLGVAFGAILHQRGELVVQGSAVVVDGAAIVFMGDSGTGKSTLAAAFARRGHMAVADDFCRIQPGREMRAHPGFGYFKLWPDSLEQLGRPLRDLHCIRPGLNKRRWPLGRGLAAAALPVRKLYLLQPYNGPAATLTAIEGVQRFNLINQQTYFDGFIAGAAPRLEHHRRVMQLAGLTPLSVVSCPDDLARLDDLVDVITADLRA
jgi:hypothetical protein